MRIAIDDELCMGHGRCWAMATDVIATADDGRGVVISSTVAPGLEAQALAAERNCPERAVVLSEERTDGHALI